MPPSRSCSSLQGAKLIKHTHTYIQKRPHKCSLARCAHSLHTLTHIHRYHPEGGKKISKLGYTTKGRARVCACPALLHPPQPPANLMHGDHFQKKKKNRTKWWAISQRQSGSPHGPRGRMACNRVRVLPE